MQTTAYTTARFWRSTRLIKQRVMSSRDGGPIGMSIQNARKRKRSSSATGFSLHHIDNRMEIDTFSGQKSYNSTTSRTPYTDRLTSSQSHRRIEQGQKYPGKTGDDVTTYAYTSTFYLQQQVHKFQIYQTRIETNIKSGSNKRKVEE